MSDRAYIASTDTESGTYAGQFRRGWAPDVMELTILPTERCNFRCTYCYEDFKIGRMSPETVQGVKTLVERRAPELNLLHITWFGGEPLAAYDIVLDLAKSFDATSHRHGMRYTSHMTTNGSLLSVDRFRALVDLGVNHYQISLDGPQEHHDRTRITMQKRGTYDVIMQNLREIRASNIPGEIMLRLHITQENHADLEPFVRQLARQFLDDPRFSVFFVPIGRLGGPNDEAIQVVDPHYVNAIVARLIDAVREEQGVLTRSHDPIVTEGGADDEGEPLIDVCYAARPNALVIRADGRLAKCTVALSSERNSIGRILPDGLLEIDNGKHNTWIKGWFDADTAALKCPAGIF
jgi:uncharacterized protein